MKKNGMIEYKNNFITKLRSFFKRFFGEKGYKGVQEELVNEIDIRKPQMQSDFIDSIRYDTMAVNFVIKQKNFLEEIKGNKEALNMLSIDRLRKLEKYYDSVIAENEKIIKKLEQQNNE